MKPKILILSDLNWNLAAKRITNNDIINLYETKSIGSSERFLSIRKYWGIVQMESPELVLLGGDLTGDGSCGHGFHNAFYYFLCLLNRSKTQTLFIQGDNDIKKYYSIVLEHLPSLPFITEISNKSVIFRGIKILGIPFEATRNKKALREIIKSNRFHDIVICHSELKRRSHLFGLDADLIITGHFDNKMCFVQNSIFLSFSNDSEVINYGTITDYRKTKQISYSFLNPQRNRKVTYSETYKNLTNNTLEGIVLSDMVPIRIEEFEKLILPNSEYEKDKNALALSLKFLRGKYYRVAIDYMYSNRKALRSSHRELNRIKSQFFTSKHKLSKSMLVDFLGSKRTRELGSQVPNGGE